MNNKKYLKVVRNTCSSNGNYEYKINEVNISDNWNPQGTDASTMGGFNFSTEDKILRWLVRGNILYDVIIPDAAEVIECESEVSPHGVFRTNKIILKNPRPLTDEIAYHLYLESDLPDKSYYKSLAGLMILGFKNTCMKLINDRITKDNVKDVLKDIDDFWHPNEDDFDLTTYKEIYEYFKNML